MPVRMRCMLRKSERESGKGFLGMEYNRSFRVGNGTNPIQVNGKSGTMTTTGSTIVRLVTAMLLGDTLLTDRGNGGWW